MPVVSIRVPVVSSGCACCEQLVCSGSGAGEAQLSRVASAVPGASAAEARQALHVAAGSYQGAVQYLKVEKLYR